MSVKQRYPGLEIQNAFYKDNQRAEINTYGFWIFLMSDLIIFGLFLATYASMDNPMGQAGAFAPKDVFNINSIALQSFALLASALSCGYFGISLKYKESNGRLIFWLLATATLGALFLILEFRDFADMWAMGATPMASGWLSSFYGLLGLHGFHVFSGIIWIMVLIALLLKNGINPRLQIRMQVFMIYWHFLDIVWIGIFSFVFLRGLS